MQPEIRLKSYRDQVEARLDELLPLEDNPPEILYRAMRYSSLAPGKRLRPTLCLLSAEVVGGSAEEVLDAACAIEMIHTFSLIHDDLPAIDDDDLRRGLPSCHKAFGEAIAILAGDALFASAFEIMVKGKGNARKRLLALQELTRAVGVRGLVGGEVLDVLNEGKKLSRRTLKTIHERKTAALFSASCAIGAILGGGTRVQIQTLRRYGHTLGLAFQIADDVLNETSTPEQLGKAVGSDRARKKLTYPGALGLSGAQEKAQGMISKAVCPLEKLPGDTELLRYLAGYSVYRLS